MKIYDVVAVTIKTGAERIMETGLTKENAEAVIKFAVMRRGVVEEFYVMRRRPTMKTEAMTENQIKELVFDHSVGHAINYECRMCSLILAWATAKAEAERAQFWYSEKDLENWPTRPQHDWTKADWLNAVLQRIGWPQDDGQGEKKDAV